VERCGTGVGGCRANKVEVKIKVEEVAEKEVIKRCRFGQGN
jgi:hypothetical protein